MLFEPYKKGINTFIDNKPAIIAHRGNTGRYPENTLKAIEDSIRCGVDAVEIDVRTCKDGKLVVIHDETLDRTTSGHGSVCNVTYSQIRRLDAGMGEHVPLFEEVLELVKDNVKVLIDMYAIGLEKKVIEIIRKYKILDQVAFSGNHSSLLRIKNFEPKAVLALTYEKASYAGILDSLLKRANYYNVFYPRLNRNHIRFAHILGLGIITWVVNDEALQELFLRSGVDAITTDKPIEALNIRRRLFGK